MRHDVIDPIVDSLLSNGVHRLSNYFGHCPSVIESEVNRTPDTVAIGKTEAEWINELYSVNKP